MASSRRQVLTYLLLVFLFSSLFYFLAIWAKHVGAGGGLYVFGNMWCPALAAFATLKVNGRNLADLGWKWPATNYALMSWYVPLIGAAIAYAIVWLSGLGGFPNRDFMAAMATRMGLRASPAVSTVVYVLLAGSFGGRAQPCRLKRRLCRVFSERVLILFEFRRNFCGIPLLGEVRWSQPLDYPSRKGGLAGR